MRLCFSSRSWQAAVPNADTRSAAGGSTDGGNLTMPANMTTLSGGMQAQDAAAFQAARAEHALSQTAMLTLQTSMLHDTYSPDAVTALKTVLQELQAAERQTAQQIAQVGRCAACTRCCIPKETCSMSACQAGCASSMQCRRLHGMQCSPPQISPALILSTSGKEQLRLSDIHFDTGHLMLLVLHGA